MSLWEVAALGIGLSMDALAVSLCKGLSMRKFNWKYGIVIAVFFGGFQAGMPVLGWLLGIRLAKYITAVDHWIAFGLLFLIGGKMILDAVREMKQKEKEAAAEPFTLKIGELFLLAVATSIDALAVGLSFAFLDAGENTSFPARMSIWTAALLIGAITFLISFVGVLAGNRFGSRFETKAQIAGGIILILLGVKILLEHLGILIL